LIPITNVIAKISNTVIKVGRNHFGRMKRPNNKGGKEPARTKRQTRKFPGNGCIPATMVHSLKSKCTAI
jgi:hypothetical protein